MLGKGSRVKRQEVASHRIQVQYPVGWIATANAVRTEPVADIAQDFGRKVNYVNHLSELNVYVFPS